MQGMIAVRSCGNGTCGGAQVGVVHLLAECGECCGPAKIVQFLLVGSVNPLKNCLNGVSDSKAMVGWGSAQDAN